MSNHRRGENTKRRAALLVVAEQDFPYVDQVSQIDSVDLFVSSWKRMSSYHNSIMCEGCSWNQGRNKLLALAMQMYRGYDYFIFSDDDVELVENPIEGGSVYLTGKF